MNLYVDGTKVVTKTGMRLRASESMKVEQFLFHNFFGGDTSDWAATKDEVRLSLQGCTFLCTVPLVAVALVLNKQP